MTAQAKRSANSTPASNDNAVFSAAVKQVAETMSDEDIGDIIFVADEENDYDDEILAIGDIDYVIRDGNTFTCLATLSCIYDTEKTTESVELFAQVSGKVVEGEPVIDRIDVDQSPSEAMDEHYDEHSRMGR